MGEKEEGEKEEGVISFMKYFDSTPLICSASVILSSSCDDI